MADSPLITKSKEFALQIIKVCNYVKQTKKESVLTNQLIRSGTSVGANIREAFYGHGTADFIGYATYGPNVWYKSWYGGVWQPLEWANPPMISGVEYRTTERHNGKVVYTKLIDFGALPNCTAKGVASGSTAGNILSFNGTAQNAGGTRYHFPIFSSGNLLAFAYIGSSSGNVTVTAITDCSGYTAEFTVKYIKD